jgi:AraC-like DNA-binding protein
MPVVFEFEVEKDFHFATEFAKRFNMPVSHHRVYLPDMLGDGFIQEVYLDNGLALCIHHYVLKQELILKRMETSSPDVLTMKFDCRTPDESYASPILSNNKGCEAELGTGNFFAELRVPANQQVDFLVIGTSRQSLLKMLSINTAECNIEKTISTNPSFVFHESMTPEMIRPLKQLIQIDQTVKLSGLLYQTKAQELIYLLFNKLLSRTPDKTSPIDETDADKIYAVRALILTDLGKIPQLPELARSTGISLTKMKQLFRQVFGDSIYNYYQAARMNEAAELLTRLSVSEVGYKIGFTNLSHFSRMFDKHHQMKPKQFKNAISLN